jgi:hypothetical protein
MKPALDTSASDYAGSSDESDHGANDDDEADDVDDGVHVCVLPVLC